MSTGWDLESFDGSGSSSDKVQFTKFPEGITRIRIVDDAPYQRWTHFMKKFSRSINCPGRGCPICEIRKQEKANKMPYSHQMSKRFAMNVINRETNRLEIMEQGKTFFADVKDMMSDLVNEHKSLQDADLKIRRRGVSQEDTSYRIDVDKIYPLSSADTEMLKNKIKLDEYFKPHTPEQILRLLQGEAWDDVMTSETKDDTASDQIDVEEDYEIQ